MSMKKISALAVAAFMLVAVAVPASAQTVDVDALKAQIAQLTAMIAQLQGGTTTTGTSTGGYQFTSNLTIGSTGADVTELQKVLVAKDYLVMPAGVAYGNFGPLTQAAVAKWQAASGISPAAGYVGPISRTALNAMAGTTTGGTTTGGTTTGTPSGEEGQIKNIDTVGDVDSSVDEGEEDVKVLGVEFDAEDSEMIIERLDVDFTKDGGDGSDNLDDYFTEVSVWFDGKKVASMDADEADEDDDVYSFRFTGLKIMVAEGKTGKIYVSTSVVNNLDSTDDNDTWDVEIPEDGMRAIDGAGISETYVGGSDNLEETITVESADAGTLDISENNNNPEDGLVVVDDSSDTNNVTLLVADIEAEDSDVDVQDFPIEIAVTGASNVDDVIKNVTLVVDGKEIETKSIPSNAGAYEAITFDDIDLSIEDGKTVEYKIIADVLSTDSDLDVGDTLVASTTGALVGWDAEDSNGDTLTESTDITGDAVGGTLTFTESGISVTKTSAVATKDTASTAGSADEADAVIVFRVTNTGDEDIWVDGDIVQAITSPTTGTDGLAWATTTNSTTGTSTYTAILDVDADGNDTDLDLNNNFVVEKNKYRDFTFSVTIPAGADNTAAGVRITGIKWDTDDDDSTANLYDFDLEDYKTNTVTGLQIR